MEFSAKTLTNLLEGISKLVLLYFKTFISSKLIISVTSSPRMSITLFQNNGSGSHL